MTDEKLPKSMPPRFFEGVNFLSRGDRREVPIQSRVWIDNLTILWWSTHDLIHTIHWKSRRNDRRKKHSAGRVDGIGAYHSEFSLSIRCPQFPRPWLTLWWLSWVIWVVVLACNIMPNHWLNCNRLTALHRLDMLVKRWWFDQTHNTRLQSW